MKYFRVKQEDRDGESVLIKGLIHLPYFQEIKLGEIRSFPASSSWYVTSNYDNALPNLLCTQLFMANKEVFDVLQQFANFDYRCMFLVDQKNVEEFYYIPQLPLIDCLSDKSIGNPSKSHLERVAIYHFDDYPDIFQIANVKERVVIISLPLAESLLRRKFSGFYLEKVVVDEKLLLSHLQQKKVIP